MRYADIGKRHLYGPWRVLRATSAGSVVVTRQVGRWSVDRHWTRPDVREVDVAKAVELVADQSWRRRGTGQSGASQRRAAAQVSAALVHAGHDPTIHGLPVVRPCDLYPARSWRRRR